MGVDRSDVEALVATIAEGSDSPAPDRSIVPPVRSEGLRERIEAMLADATRLSFGPTLGQGGMGVVRAAEQLALHREVAVKTLRGERSDAAVAELLREALVTGSLEHPNIVPVHYIGVGEGGEPFIVLKKIEGEAWEELIASPAAIRERFACDPLDWHLRVLLEVIDAVRFAHSRGVIHRDLKPANVMVGEFGEVYVLDWGIAVSLEPGDGWLPLASEVTEIAGTLGYMAPEMLAARGLSERTDVYLLGAVLYEIATGRPPHRGKTIYALTESILASDPEFPPDVPPELAAICRRAMRPDPADRYPSARALKAAIESFREHREASRLAGEAEVRLAALLDACAAEDADRDEVYNLFGECRFGFHEAMRRWPEGRQARAGLEQAVTAMAEYELGRGAPAAAERLLAEIESVPAGLRDRVERELTRHRDKLDALERLEADLDLGIGSGRRMVGALVLVLITIGTFGVYPALDPSVATSPTWPQLLGMLLGAGLVLGMLIFSLRAAVRSSRPNRLYALGIVVTWLGTMAAIATLWLAGYPPAVLQHLHPVIWFTNFGMVVGAVDTRLWPAAVVYLGAGPLVAVLPLFPGYFVLIGSMVFMLANLWWVSRCHLREGRSAAAGRSWIDPPEASGRGRSRSATRS